MHSVCTGSSKKKKRKGSKAGGSSGGVAKDLASKLGCGPNNVSIHADGLQGGDGSLYADAQFEQQLAATVRESKVSLSPVLAVFTKHCYYLALAEYAQWCMYCDGTLVSVLCACRKQHIHLFGIVIRQLLHMLAVRFY
jgi:hypothetical protein